MTVDYRLARPEDEAGLLALWLTVYPETDRAKWLREWRALDPGSERTFAAVGADGSIVTSALYWPVMRRAADGTPTRVGQLSHVATHPGHRRQGHATRLIELAIQAMARDGCEWSLLFTSDEARPLYERLGWCAYERRAWAGLVSASRVDRYDVRQLDPIGPGGWGAVHTIHAAFNGDRPLSTVRDNAYWQGHFRARVTDWIAVDGAFLLVALEGDAARAYALAHATPQGCFVAELGALPGHEPAVAALLSEVAGRTGAAEARILVQAPADLVPAGFQARSSAAAMARPIAGDGIADAFADARAVSWPFDET